MGQRLDFAKFPGFIVIVRERNRRKERVVHQLSLGFNCSGVTCHAWWIYFLTSPLNIKKVRAQIWSNCRTIDFSCTWSVWINVIRLSIFVGIFRECNKWMYVTSNPLYIFHGILPKTRTLQESCALQPKDSWSKDLFFFFFMKENHFLHSRLWIVQSKEKINICLSFPWNACWWNMGLPEFALAPVWIQPQRDEDLLYLGRPPVFKIP